MNKAEIDIEKVTGWSKDDYADLCKMDMVDIGRTMIQAREELDLATALKSRCEKRYDALKRLLPKKMEDQGVEKFTVDGRGIRVQIEVYASIPADHRDMAYEWLRKHGLGDVISNTVNGSTLKAMVKEQISIGHHLPEDLFKVMMEPQARFY